MFLAFTAPAHLQTAKAAGWACPLSVSSISRSYPVSVLRPASLGNTARLALGREDSS